MNQICRKTFRVDLRRRINRRVSTLKKYVRVAWERILRFSCCKVSRYRQLSVMATSTTASASATPSPASATPSPSVLESCFSSGYPSSTSLNNDDHNNNNSNSDLVSLKIGLLGDCHIGKTSFLMKYVGNGKEESNGGYEINKTLFVKGARISYSIWEVEGDDAKAQDQIPVACKDSVAILFMFDLTSRCTLNSVISWYKQAKKYNQAAIPIMIGTKFDDFIQLPLDLQWTIASQARAYAKAINATLFFSSATYNINVNKIFKFITAKLFDLPWTVERNLTIGEPIIDF